MTCEDIIQRLLDEKHITVKEAMIMIKELVKNLSNEPVKKETLVWPEDGKIKVKPEEKKNPFWDQPPSVVMYGIETSPYDNDFNSITHISSNNISIEDKMRSMKLE